jgi:hypothetical protein
MDIVVGIGRLFGFTLPENFNRPFTSKSFLEFWTRWHITLSEWFQAHVYYPLMKGMLSRWQRSKLMEFFPIIGYFVTFFLVGYWHVPSLFLSLILAVGASGNRLYQIAVSKVLGRARHSTLNKNFFYQGLCRGLTFSYLSVTLTPLWWDMGKFYELTKGAAVLVFIGSWLGLGLVSAIIYLMIYGVAKAISGLSIRPSLWFEGPITYRCFVALKLFLMSFLLIRNINPAPAFVYMGF